MAAFRTVFSQQLHYYVFYDNFFELILFGSHESILNWSVTKPGKISAIIFPTFFSYINFFLFFYDFISTNVSFFLYWSTDPSRAVFCFFFPNFFYFVFQTGWFLFTDSFICPPHSTLEPTQWIFITYYIFFSSKIGILFFFCSSSSSAENVYFSIQECSHFLNRAKL